MKNYYKLIIGLIIAFIAVIIGVKLLSMNTNTLPAIKSNVQKEPSDDQDDLPTLDETEDIQENSVGH